jgi:F-type H+-transporting ATPase subunit alpha
MEILKQPQNQPYPLDHQVYLIFAGTRGYLDTIDIERVEAWIPAFLRYMDTAFGAMGTKVRETGQPPSFDELGQAINDFNATWSN